MALLVQCSKGRRRVLKKLLLDCVKLHLLRLRPPSGVVNYTNEFNPTLDDATSIERNRFTMPQLQTLSVKFGLPETIVTPSGDNVTRLEALAVLCRRQTEPSKLFTIANEFGRSTSAISRIFLFTARRLYSTFADLLYMNRKLIADRMDIYCCAVKAKGSPLDNCWAFIDGTKQYIARPSPRAGCQGRNENLQRSVYNGHPRRHCLNWQAVTTPDGIIQNFYGSVEGRRHDSTVLCYSKLLDVMHADDDRIFDGRIVYGDPAYGCNSYIICPFPHPAPGSTESRFNSRMSQVREAVEWSFGRLKTLWPFVFDAKKMQVRRTPVGKLFYVAVLLTNCHCCLQPFGNQITMYFHLEAPSLDDYLGSTQ
ncbi:hypothetical protein LEN26_001730 [Aphanomyces euteiches]|nr:hypothetical protein AeMF1_005740 [Aphanomyces euteiches]KAH9160725.1 hypothetical protein LEN26_001730 [Aphanomyces euteiches]KAH9184019.1 hypothetical protein AeNC1_014004 [Aphanomyces euteiches]